MSLVRAPAVAEPLLCLAHRVGQPLVFGLLGLVVADPALALTSAPVLPAAVAPGEEARSPVLAGFEVQEFHGHIPEQGTVVRHDHDPARVLPKPFGEKRQTVHVEMVGRLVQHQQVVARPQQAGQANPVALTDRQRRQRALSIGAGIEPGQRHIDPALRIPGVQASSRIECGSVRLIRSVPTLGHRRRPVVERLQGAVGLPHRTQDEGAHRLAAARLQRLPGDANGADPVHRPLVRHDHAGQHVQQGRLATAVLADDGQA